jgi:hypothetical protein
MNLDTDFGLETNKNWDSFELKGESSTIKTGVSPNDVH